MKKILALMLTLALALPFASCEKDNSNDITNDDGQQNVVENLQEEENEVTDENNDQNAEENVQEEADTAVMSYAEFTEAAIDSEVTVETYVQAKQSWWDNKGTFYTQSEDGAYFLYEMPCTEEEYNKLVPGTKIRVTGYKAEWSGEVEIVDAKYEIFEGEYIAEAFDATALLGTDELVNHQNKLALFKGMTVKAVEYKNEAPGDDIYVTLGLGEADYEFCVEVYLTGVDSDVYTTVGSLNVGDIVDVEAFLYWYNGANPHIYSIAVAAE